MCGFGTDCTGNGVLTIIEQFGLLLATTAYFPLFRVLLLVSKKKPETMTGLVVLMAGLALLDLAPMISANDRGQNKPQVGVGNIV